MADQDYPNLYEEMEDSAQRTRAAAISFEHVLGGPETDMVPVNGYPAQPTIAGRVKDRLDPLVATIESAAEGAKRFAGVHATAPTTRYDGTPLQLGDEYQNSTDSLRYNWNGSTWTALNADVQQLTLALSSTTDPSKGSGVIKHNDSLPYLPGTVGDKLRKLPTAADVAAATDAATAAHNANPGAHPALSALVTSEANRAQAAADAAQLSAGVFADTVAGLGATTSGKYFSVPSGSSSEYLILYRNNAGSAVEVKRYPSVDFVAALRPEIYDQTGRAPLVRNLFDLNRTTDGFFIDSAGGATADALYFISDYIPVTEAQQHTFARAVSSIAFYGLTKGFISRVAGAAAGGVFSTPAGAQFLRFSHTLSTGKTKQMLVKGATVPSSYIGFGYTDPATQDKKTHTTALELLDDRASGATNMFDPTRTLDNTSLSANGSTTATTGYLVSRYTPVKQLTTYTMSRSSSVVCFYDSNKVFISNISATAATPFTSPADACFMRYHLTPLTTKATFMLVEGSVLPTSYVAFGSPTSASVNLTAVEVARAVTEAALPLVRNLFDLNRARLDKSISADNGAISTTAGYFVTGLLPVTPGGFFVSTYGPSNLCFYDLGGVFISGSTAYSSFGNKPVPVPAGAYFIQFQVSPLSRLQGLMVSPGDAVPAGYIPFGGATSKLPWQDKKLVILGDSISATALYVPALLAGTGMSLLANHAVAGRPVREMGKTTAGIVLQTADLASADVVHVFGATNDFGGGRALGTMADAYTGSVVATFYNDVFQLLTLLYTLKPTVRVVFSTPLKRGAFEGQPVYPAPNSAGAKLDQYVKAIVEVCELFSVPVCNLFRDGGFNLLNLGAYTGDNLHPNAAGSALHVRPMIATINAC